VSQDQFAAAWVGRKIDADDVWWSVESGDPIPEDEATGTVNLEIFAVVLNVLTIASIREDEAATHARVYLGSDHFPARRGEQELPGQPRVQPGVEDALGGVGEDPADPGYDRRLGRNRHWCTP
jgi:hypothetical protein